MLAHATDKKRAPRVGRGAWGQRVLSARVLIAIPEEDGMSEYAATFQLIDTDGDGRISAEELVRLMEVLGRPLTPEGAQGAIDKVDADRDGLIDLEEFGVWLSGH
ncbi:EF-hand domain-containing protein [Microbispora sp. NPDC046933]|uniref:EF-hand domain-containing protein n=1 Tax=Microbispora sp. NPDC046933 TaxID=3155618 RepID=UPI0033D055E5